MFTSSLYDPCAREKYRYLIKHQGVWKILETWAARPDWDDEVTDVICLRSDSMIASWWQMKDGRRRIKRPPIKVQDEELAMLMLQVENV